LFSEEGYWQFMNKYWFPGFYRQFKEKKCEEQMADMIETGSGCSGASIIIATKPNDLVLKLQSECEWCMDGYSITVSFDELKKYTSDWAKDVIYTRNYYQAYPLAQAKGLEILQRSVPDFIFTRALISGDTTDITITLYTEELGEGGSDGVEYHARGTMYNSDGTQSNLTGIYVPGENIRLEIEGLESYLALDFHYVDQRTINTVTIGDNQLEGSLAADRESKGEPFRMLSFSFNSSYSFAQGKISSKWR
jgi:hypothetical protein